MLSLLNKQHEIDFSLYKPATVHRRIEAASCSAPSRRSTPTWSSSRRPRRTQPPLQRPAHRGDPVLPRRGDPREPAETRRPQLGPGRTKRSACGWRCATKRPPWRFCSTKPGGGSAAPNNGYHFRHRRPPGLDRVCRRGPLRPDSLHEVMPDRLSRYFAPVGVQVIPDLRQMITFAPQNMITDAFTRMDLVTCRNVLIYFRQQVQTQIIRCSTSPSTPAAVFSWGPRNDPALPRRVRGVGPALADLPQTPRRPAARPPVCRPPP